MDYAKAYGLKKLATTMYKSNSGLGVISDRFLF
jgi:hypothetical protein